MHGSFHKCHKTNERYFLNVTLIKALYFLALGPHTNYSAALC